MVSWRFFRGFHGHPAGLFRYLESHGVFSSDPKIFGCKTVWKSQLIWHLGHRMRSKLEAFPNEVCLFAAVSDGYGLHFV